ncbi:hypothetical protein, partial [Rothia mucilaginosa]|uniref:hypothetical protein n=1 Tax=Rothia mucilaginosa TaxID=43675 RepID=UPI0028D8741E
KTGEVAHKKGLERVSNTLSGTKKPSQSVLWVLENLQKTSQKPQKSANSPPWRPLEPENRGERDPKPSRTKADTEPDDSGTIYTEPLRQEGLCVYRERI